MTFPKSPRFGAPKQSGARQEPLRHGIFDTFDTSTGDPSGGDRQPIPTNVGKRPMEKRWKPMKNLWKAYEKPV